jgi:DNA (cytosine-5)-methyltransferase 1
LRFWLAHYSLENLITKRIEFSVCEVVVGENRKKSVLEIYMLDYIVKNIGEHRGAPRIFLDAAQASRAGFAPGDAYDVRIDENRRVTVYACPDGSRRVVGREDKKTGLKTKPVMDLNSAELKKVFKGCEACRMIIRNKEVILLPLASEIAKKERVDRLRAKLENNEPIDVASISHGLGILGKAIHDGLKEAGLEARTRYINEIREDLAEHARLHNDAWSDETVALVAPMQELVQDEWLMKQLKKVEVFDFSLPCSGASRAGATKNKIEKMEDHEHVGHLVFAALVLINKFQPVVLVGENVTAYANSASASILRKQLRDMGYDTHEAIVNGRDVGLLEDRERWCIVGVTKGLKFDFAQLYPPVTVVAKVGDIIEDVPLDDPRWTANTGLKAKEERDIADGKGFRLPIVTPDSEKVPTLRKGYQKKGSCDVQLQHPENPELARLFTGREHLRLKGIDHRLFGEDASDAMIHQAAGQAVQPPVFIPIGKRIGEALLNAAPYERAKREIAIEEVASVLKDGIAYDPVPSVRSVMAKVQESLVQRDLFAEPEVDDKPDESVSENDDKAPRAAVRRRKIGGGGVG